MKVAIMQPYLFPYIGYFQLIHAVDTFVLLDDVNYIKGGWINRNRILLNGQAHMFTLPLKKASQNRKISELQLYEPFGSWLEHFCTKLHHAYAGAPAYPELRDCFVGMSAWQEWNLVDVLEKTLLRVCEKLAIRSRFLRSSSFDSDPALHGQARIIQLCKQLGATEYFNLSGGKDLYQASAFAEYGLRLHFLEATPLPYRQLKKNFVPFLSIIDMLVFNSAEVRFAALDEFSLTSCGVEA